MHIDPATPLRARAAAPDHHLRERARDRKRGVQRAHPAHAPARRARRQARRHDRYPPQREARAGAPRVGQGEGRRCGHVEHEEGAPGGVSRGGRYRYVVSCRFTRRGS